MTATATRTPIEIPCVCHNGTLEEGAHGGWIHVNGLGTCEEPYPDTDYLRDLLVDAIADQDTALVDALLTEIVNVDGGHREDHAAVAEAQAAAL